MKKTVFFPINRSENIAFYIACISIVLLSVLIVLIVKTSFEIALIVCFGVIIMLFCLDLLRLNSIKNLNSFFVKITKNKIIMFYNLFLFKKIKLDSKIQVFSIDQYLCKREAVLYNVGGIKDIDISQMNDECFKINKFFVITNNFDMQKKIKIQMGGKLLLDQNVYDSFINLMCNKSVIILDGNYNNFKFLRQRIGYEKFLDFNNIEEGAVANFEKLLIEEIENRT